MEVETYRPLRTSGVNVSENIEKILWDCAYQAVPLHTSMAFPREPPRATLAIVKAPVICAVHIVVPLLLLYAIINHVTTIPIIISCSVPWEWEVSTNLPVRDVARKCSAASADECRQAQRSDSSSRGFMI